MKLQKYNIDYSVPPFGFYNSGVLCYLNTTIQTLFSIPLFNEMINNTKHDDNILVVELRYLYTDIKKYSNTKLYDLQLYLKSLIGTSIIDGRQNDSFEILKFILELLPNDFYNIFYLKYHIFIQCANCNKITNKNIQNELTVNLSLQETLDGKILNNNENINEYVKKNVNFLEDYKCDLCNKKNTSLQVFNIGNIPNSIIISFHDNHDNLLNNKSRVARYFPSHLSFTTKQNSNVNYIPVAHVKHYGHLGGGHYNGEFLRNTTYLQNKINLLNKKIKTLTNQQQIKQYKEYINKISNRNPLSICSINDSHFNEINDFTQSQNTYYVVYTIEDIK